MIQYKRQINKNKIQISQAQIVLQIKEKKKKIPRRSEDATNPDYSYYYIYF